MKKPKEFTIAPLREEVYHLLYRNLKLEEVKRTIVDFVRVAGCNVSKIYELLFEWLKKLFVDWGLEEPSEEDLFVCLCSPAGLKLNAGFQFGLVGLAVGLKEENSSRFTNIVIDKPSY